MRTFYLIVLSLLGSLAFAISVYEGFQATLVQWLSRYITVYLWLPVADLFSAMLARIQTLSLDRDMALMQSDPLYFIDGSNMVYLIFMIIGIFGYFTVPTVAGWIVQAGGMGSYNRMLSGAGSKIVNIGTSAAGAMMGNVWGRALGNSKK